MTATTVAVRGLRRRSAISPTPAAGPEAVDRPAVDDDLDLAGRDDEERVAGLALGHQGRRPPANDTGTRPAASRSMAVIGSSRERGTLPQQVDELLVDDRDLPDGRSAGR